jgi:hypothetical protein
MNALAWGMGELQIQLNHVTNFISAGQVTKSPLEIIVELIENSIDAKSCNISNHNLSNETRYICK